MLQQMLEEPVSKYTSYELVVVRENVTVSDCVKEMVGKKIDSVLISEDDEIVGIITDKYSCPYCASVFENKQGLSRHIDDIHIGRGLLEGNITKIVSE